MMEQLIVLLGAGNLVENAVHNDDKCGGGIKIKVHPFLFFVLSIHFGFWPVLRTRNFKAGLQNYYIKL